MTTLQQYYNEGLTLDEYLDHMKVNKEEMVSIYKKFDLPVNDPRLQTIKDKNLNVIVITEDWCGDAMMNIPILLKIAEATNMNVKFSLRDENLDLIDQYLTNGTARSIPIFIFIDENYKQQSVWGPRATEVQAFVDSIRKDLPKKDSEEFAEANKEKIKEMTNEYITSPVLWAHVYESITSRIVEL